METTILGVLGLGVILWIVLMAISHYTSQSYDQYASKRGNYRIVTDGDKFDYELRSYHNMVPFGSSWANHTGKYYFKSMEETEEYIDRKIQKVREAMMADNRSKRIVKTL